MVSLNGQRIATEQDFDGEKGILRPAPRGGEAALVLDRDKVQPSVSIAATPSYMPCLLRYVYPLDSIVP